jgi:ubiquitin C-terminal hydrolase
MDLIKYNTEFSINPVGFHNNGVICYFNSVLQSLLSCTSFIEKVKHITNLNNPVIRFLNELIDLHMELTKLDVNQNDKESENSDEEINTILELNEIKSDNQTDAAQNINNIKKKIQMMGIILWKVMVLVNKKKNSDFSFNGQQCASEGFNHLLESIDEFTCIKNLFMHKYNTNLYCFDCSKWVSTVDNISNIFVVDPELYTHQLDEFKQFDIKENDIFNELYNISDLCKLNQYVIKQNSFVDKNYKCPKCNKIGEKYKLNYLVMIPEILVIMSKKYDNNLQKKEILTEFPETLMFSGNNNNILTYKAVSQVEHSGNLNSGHYWSISKRRDGNWYKLNDSSVCKSKFTPTKQTYMVFYHIDKI